MPRKAPRLWGGWGTGLWLSAGTSSNFPFLRNWDENEININLKSMIYLWPNLICRCFLHRFHFCTTKFVVLKFQSFVFTISWPGLLCWKILNKTKNLIFISAQEAMCVVGTVSIHPLKALPISSPNRMRWLGKLIIIEDVLEMKYYFKFYYGTSD